MFSLHGSLWFLSVFLMVPLWFLSGFCTILSRFVSYFLCFVSGFSTVASFAGHWVLSEWFLRCFSSVSVFVVNALLVVSSWYRLSHGFLMFP